MKHPWFYLATTLVAVGVAGVAQAAIPFNETWTGTEYILGNIRDGNNNARSQFICLGQAKWHVTGTINGRGFSEDWTVGYNAALPRVSSFYTAGTLLTDANGVPLSKLYPFYMISDTFNRCDINDNGDFIDSSDVVFQPTGLYGVEVSRYDPRGSDSWGQQYDFTALRAIPREWFVRGTINN